MASSFGEECRKEFLLDPDQCFINHGSYGATPHIVYNKRLELLKQQETNPDHWFRRVARPLWEENIEAAAKFIGADPKNVVLVSNATSGINSAVKSIPFTSSDAILVNTWTYKAIQNVCHSAITKAGGELLYVEMSIPIHKSADTVDKYRTMLSRNPNIRLVIIDLISSATATRWPLSELVALCKEHNALVLVDGAHAPGQVPLNVEEMGESGVDFFIGNFHKWVYTPRGCAVLWCHPRHHPRVRPVLTSHCYNFPSLHDDFFTQGTNDTTQFFTLRDGVDYYNSKGGMDKIMAHNVSLASRGVSLLLEKWGTYPFPVPPDMEAPFMRLVRVPDLPTHPVPDEFKTAPFDDCHSLMTELYEKYNIICVVLYVSGEPWVRISAQIYNTIRDYEALADAVLDIKRRGHSAGDGGE